MDPYRGLTEGPWQFYSVRMTPDMMAIITVGVALGGLMITLLQRLDKRIDGLDKRIGGLEKEVAALKATVETFFRVRIDPPPPGSEHHDQAA